MERVYWRAASDQLTLPRRAGGITVMVVGPAVWKCAAKWLQETRRGRAKMAGAKRCHLL